MSVSHPILTVFRSRNYCLFFVGQLISLIGTWLAQVALSWLVYEMTGKKVLLGTVVFISQIPAFILAPVCGVLADRWDRRKILIWTQTLMMVQAFLMAILTLIGKINVPWILILAAMNGICMAMDVTARQSFVIQMVDEPQCLPAAIALNSAMFNLCRFLGPAVGALLIHRIGTGNCFLLNAVSFIAVIIALFYIKPRAIEQRKHAGSIIKQFGEGLEYVKSVPSIFYLLLLLTVMNLIGTPFNAMMPAYAKDVFNNDSRGYSLMVAAIGLGASLGGITLASRGSARGLEKWIIIGTAIFGILLSSLGWITHLNTAIALLGFTGFFMIFPMVASNTLLQSLVDESKRGRVMSFFGMTFYGMMPIGSLIVGALAETKIGLQGIMKVSGVGCVITAALFCMAAPAIKRQLEKTLPLERTLPAEGPAFEVIPKSLENDPDQRG